MNYRIDRCRSKDRSQQLVVTDIALEEERPLPGNLCHTIEHFIAAVREIIDNGHGVARGEQCDTGMRSDIAGTTSDQDVHPPAFQESAFMVGIAHR
ncbi:MAG: hypothetical protein AW09_003180 [Candidatus Accumulibacter phosphatis]|uniref:Uncharacterized protein n=1 Tax=Candidatus Accumulibacter phosphatis TaxID=327160 RepID=A0A080LVD6_9PROT|nr:MAG: hypothetical protein AW09_003180 [Candidatus Accumulibacter phosphatis]